MNNVTRFAYAQVRLQARHGQRADQQVWRRLHTTGDLSNYLQLARHTVLRPWVMGIDSSRSSHHIEFFLRSQYCRYVDDVCRWLPAAWRAAFEAWKGLSDLPALQYLLRGDSLPVWMPDDPALRHFAIDNHRQRIEALRAAGQSHLVQAWQQGRPLYEAWYDNWRHQWPGPARLHKSMDQLGRLLSRRFVGHGSGNAASTRQQREALSSRLTVLFRNSSFQPAAAFAHLALVALDLEMLRGDLLSRKLFAGVSVTLTGSRVV